jgi:hypothetical protein
MGSDYVVKLYIYNQPWSIVKHTLLGQSMWPSKEKVRVTSHTRLRARNHYTSSTLIGKKGEAGPSPLPTIPLSEQQSM